MFCSSCGSKNAAESNFCRKCGLKLEALPSAKISEEEFDRAMPEDEQVAALLELAYRRRKESDVAGAIGLCKEVLALRPNSTTAHGLLGQLYEQTGDRDKAVEQYESVLKLNPGSIADRVKLDDLRDGRAPQPAGRKALPMPYTVDPNGAQMRSAMIWGVGTVVMIILSGALLAIAFNRRTGEPDRSTGADSRFQAFKPVGDAASKTDFGKPETNTTAIVSKPAEGASNAAQGFGSTNNFPTYSMPGVPVIQYSSPPVYIYPPGYGSRPPVVQPAAVVGAARRQPKTGAIPERGPSDSDVGGERVVLRVSDGSTGGDGHEQIIKIGAHGDTKGTSQPGTKQGPEIQPRIVVKPHVGPVDTSTAGAATSDSAALIAAGQDRLNKMDYAGAIVAFRKALNGANDEAAYVYEQMGHSYKAHSETQNAKASYERGRDEYRKLIAAGRQLDRAGEGLKICENGIKICTSE